MSDTLITFTGKEKGKPILITDTYLLSELQYQSVIDKALIFSKIGERLYRLKELGCDICEVKFIESEELKNEIKKDD